MNLKFYSLFYLSKKKKKIYSLFYNRGKLRWYVRGHNPHKIV